MKNATKWIVTGLSAVGLGGIGYWLYTKRPWETAPGPAEAPVTNTYAAPTPAPVYAAPPRQPTAAELARRVRLKPTSIAARNATAAAIADAQRQALQAALQGGVPAQTAAPQPQAQSQSADPVSALKSLF